MTLGTRPSWDEYFMGIAQKVAARATCLSRKVGAVLVKDNQIVTVGYNGAPRGVEHCDSKGCRRRELKIPTGQRYDLCRAIHAEMNAVIQAALHGTSVAGATLYCTTQPCMACARVMINAGIKRIVVSNTFDDAATMEMIKESGIQFKHVMGE